MKRYVILSSTDYHCLPVGKIIPVPELRYLYSVEDLPVVTQ